MVMGRQFDLILLEACFAQRIDIDAAWEISKDVQDAVAFVETMENFGTIIPVE
jgi:hypothetical protein